MTVGGRPRSQNALHERAYALLADRCRGPVSHASLLVRASARETEASTTRLGASGRSDRSGAGPSWSDGNSSGRKDTVRTFSGRHGGMDRRKACGGEYLRESLLPNDCASASRRCHTIGLPIIVLGFRRPHRENERQNDSAGSSNHATYQSRRTGFGFGRTAIRR